MNSDYPYPLPKSVTVPMDAIRSASSFGTRSNVQGSTWVRIIVVDVEKHRRYESVYFEDVSKLPVRLPVSWIPSSTVRVTLETLFKSPPVTTTKVTGPGFYTKIHRLDYVIDRKVNVVVLKQPPSRLQFFAQKSIESIHRLRKARGVTKVKARRVPTHRLPRPSPEDTWIKYPWVHYSEGSANASGTHNINTHHRDWTGVNTPNFKRVKHMGQLPVNPHHVFLRNINDSGFWYAQTWKTLPYSELWVGDYENGGHGPSVPTASHTTIQRNRAIRKLIDRAGQEVNNIAQDLVQMNQTTSLISNSLKRISGSIDALKQLRHATSNGEAGRSIARAINFLWDAKGPVNPRWRDPKLNRSKTLAENWLELQYGWKPLLQDIHGSIASWRKFSFADRSIQTVYASANNEETDSRVIRPNAAGSPPAIGSYLSTKTSRTKMSLRFKVDNHWAAFLAQTGFNNPVNLAWEILPYSFVVDWFLPIGPFLESLYAFDGLIFLDGAETNFTRESASWSEGFSGDTYPYGTPSNQVWKMMGSRTAEIIRLDRTKLTVWPAMNVPVFKSPLSTTHIANGLALIRTLEDRFYHAALSKR